MELKQPQFIFWVKQEGVFKPAELKMPEGYLGHDLESNVELGEQKLVLGKDIQSHSSVYLGPINIFEERFGSSMITENFERLRQYKHGIVQGIVNLAEQTAEEQRVQYFAVNFVQTPKDRTWRFVREDESLEKLFDNEKYILLNERDKQIKISDKILKDMRKKFYEPKPLEFVLHPTAQLYVSKK